MMSMKTITIIPQILQHSDKIKNNDIELEEINPIIDELISLTK